LLAPWRSQLERLRDSSADLRSNLIGLLPQDLVCEGQYSGIGFKLNDANSFAEQLLKITANFNLVKELHVVDDDILGRYQFVSNGGRTSASACLYWAVIGLVARSLGVSLEGLTVNVLAHELAHAYTHLGADIDGHRWDDDAFLNSARAVKEGLAQYYTRQLLHRLKGRIPEALEAYEALLPNQPDEYRIQETWIEGGATPEHMRLAMVLFRRGRKKTLEDFELILGQAKKDLRTRTRNYSVFEDET
jgi:tetratricopeptide (TPR) repeat protein